ncbi:hypothetical protein GCM10020367_61590 [Streptomyces sannanensis]|uniref:Transposase n=1 Tax=Streptomyces sannanensis TaxID=285536 RepID=A0ABP6SKD9_9ACTN
MGSTAARKGKHGRQPPVTTDVNDPRPGAPARSGAGSRYGDGWMPYPFQQHLHHLPSGCGKYSHDLASVVGVRPANRTMDFRTAVTTCTPPGPRPGPRPSCSGPLL